MALQRYTPTHRNDFAMIASVVPARAALELDQQVLGSVQVATRFLWGADDTFGDAQVARRLVAMIPEADMVTIPDAGHLPWLDAPRRLATETISFLTERPSIHPTDPARAVSSEETPHDDRNVVR